MIAIVNIGGGDPKDVMGIRDYEVRINHEVITTFKHKRSDGLGACLFAAAKAVERSDWEIVEEFMQSINTENK